MKYFNIGYLSLFLGTIVGLGIGIVLSLVFKNQTFPVLRSGLYFGELEFKNNKYHLLFELPENNQDIIINRIGQNHTSRSTEKLSSQKVGFFKNNGFQPVPLNIESSNLSLVGSQKSTEKYSGRLLDANRNNVGIWSVSLVDSIPVKSKEEEIKLRNLLDLVKDSSDLNVKISNSEQESQKLDSEISRANTLLKEIKNLSMEGEAKLKEAKIAFDKSEKKRKITEQKLVELQQQVIVAQKYSPQGKLYEASKESLRLEKKWFFRQIQSIQNNDAKESL